MFIESYLNGAENKARDAMRQIFVQKILGLNWRLVSCQK